ncbi:SAM-dependent methyltransferase [Desulfobacter sp.]|uniref:SAM-dependent methyltransferase n=1 Tax=Desulfobacter sp. TaxID=2294 RepID=UPI003D125388
MRLLRLKHLLLTILSLSACIIWSCGAFAAGQETGFYLVSIGCGDPDNITVRAIKTIEKSQVIFCDDTIKTMWPDLLKGKECLPTPPIAIHKYFRAKESGFAQGNPEQNKKAAKAEKALKSFVKTVTDAVKSGKIVSLLDYGDPCIYGPYIWTVDVLKQFNPKVIPGVSSFNAANAAIGRGLTFGQAAKSAILTNGADLRDGYEGADTLDRLCASHSSMVLFTMFTDFEKLVKELSSRYPEDTPMAIVVKAGYEKDEQVIKGTLSDIVAKAKAFGKVPFENLIYVGDFMAE